jgi:hypothetical protein
VEDFSISIMGIFASAVTEWLLIGCGSSYCIAAAAVQAFKGMHCSVRSIEVKEPVMTVLFSSTGS